MKLVKRICFYALAMGTVTASLGVSSAAATSTALCTVHTEPCPAGNIYTGHVEGLATHVEILDDVENIICTHSVFLGNALGLANPLVIHLELLDFSGCKNTNGFTCTITTVTLGLLLLLRDELNEGELQEHGTEFRVACTDFFKCIFGGLPTLDAKGGKPAKITASAAALGIIKSEGFITCPKTATLHGVYDIILPSPLLIMT